VKLALQFLLGLALLLQCQKSSPHWGVWVAKEQCFWNQGYTCADLEKEDTISHWVFVDETTMRYNDTPCDYRILGENLVLECHGLGKMVYEIQIWTDQDLQVFDPLKKEIFRWKR